MPTTQEVVRRRFGRVITVSRGYRGGDREAFNFLLGRQRRVRRPPQNSNRLPLHNGWSPPVTSHNGLSDAKQPTNFVVCVRVDTDSNTSLFNVRCFAVKFSTPVLPVIVARPRPNTRDVPILIITITINYYHNLSLLSSSSLS